MGDDGDGNRHMIDSNEIADSVATNYPGFLVKKIMWDAYNRESSSTGNTYPEVTRAVKQLQSAGALVMNYSGHGSEIQISHEVVLKLNDFEEFTNTNLPLWVAAGCDFMPFDGVSANIGEASVLNKKGGSVAFFGTTRTVFRDRNAHINRVFMRHVLSRPNGKPITLGEAQRLAKNEMIARRLDTTQNKLEYGLLGDPAISLNLPTFQAEVDEINGIATTESTRPVLKAGTIAKVKGHIVDGESFNGVVNATVRDSEETVVCKLNDTSPTSAFTYKDRTKILYNGSDSVRAGQFEFTFAVPKDINYSDASGMITLHAVNSNHDKIAHGSNTSFIVGGSDIASTDSIGPSIYCYLNSPSFTNGDNVNTTPYFVAQVSDEDGINSTGNGIGHDLQLIVDGDMTKTYVLNDNFRFDFGSFTSGSTYYSLPELSPGKHRLLFRAWDVLNNSSVAELDFNVVEGLQPKLFNVSCTNNPATTATTFIVNHDRTGSLVDIVIDVFDVSGRILWTHEESGVSTTSAYTVDWDLTVDNGQRLQTGVYLYRVRVTCEGSKEASKAKKLIVIGNN